jgi:hypothetical protein
MVMDRDFEKLYLVVLVQQLESAAFAFDEIEEQATYHQMDEVMRRIHAFLTHAAAASRVLWPQPGPGQKGSSRKQRGEQLCTLLNLKASNPLGRRKVRNILEHFDDELDQLLVTLGSRRVTLQSLNGDPSTDPNKPLAFRDYNTRTRTFTVLGESENLGELREAIQSIGAAAYALLNARYLEEGGYPENILGTFPQRRERFVIAESSESDPAE